MFILITKWYLKVGTLLGTKSVHSQRDSKYCLKQKSPIFYQNRAFLELADGFEPPTG